MRINNISNNINFNSIYRIRNVENEAKLIQEVIAPYSYIRHKGVTIQHGENIYTQLYEHDYEVCCNSTGYAKDWLIMNAKNHELDIKKPPMDTIMIYTDEKDFAELKSALDEEGKRRTPGLFDKFKRLFGADENLNEQAEIYKNAAQLPRQLRSLYVVSEVYKKLSQRFEEHFKNKIVDVSTPEELLKAMMNER